MKQFGRQLRLTLSGKGQSLIIDNLRVAFEIEKTINEKPNPASIHIWNLNRNHLNQLLSKQLNEVSLDVGYGELRMIYQGEILQAKIKRDGLDFVMSLECADGYTDYSTARSAVTLKAGSTDEQIVTEIQKTLKKTQKGAMAFTSQRQLPRGKVLSGDSREILNRIAKNHQADWSIQDGKLIFLPKAYTLHEEAVLLSQQSGMIGMPEHTDEGLEVKCLLNPALQIGGVIQVDSIIDHFDGEYKIVKLAHSGDNYQGDWLSKMTVVGGKFQKVEKKSEKKEKGDTSPSH
ncbi:hypothetical protein A4G19_15885 [Pasteurellaceae bacterium Macca]|nr:hypothetical protein [Pasteurellaceae bacterium Macca]MCK3656155.1 hypothetical protein [Pasteurellaceae bacterium Macca]MCK3656251.1 hypothetical protein [Pasteurellaceae bacterium Macca]MCK3657136.1 hypothetical protein [Pasteurellaceae bacterium Macca]